MFPRLGSSRLPKTSLRSGGSSADVDATRAGAVSVRRIRTLSSSGSSWDGVRADPGLKLMDPLPEERRWRAFPRFPLIDDGLTGGADQARESSLADVEVSAQRFELNVMKTPRRAIPSRLGSSTGGGCYRARSDFLDAVKSSGSTPLSIRTTWTRLLPSFLARPGAGSAHRLARNGNSWQQAIARTRVIRHLPRWSHTVRNGSRSSTPLSGQSVRLLRTGTIALNDWFSGGLHLHLPGRSGARLRDRVCPVVPCSSSSLKRFS